MAKLPLGNERCILSTELGYDTQSDLVIFVLYNEKERNELERIFKTPKENDTENTFSEVHIVIITETIQEKLVAQEHKKEIKNNIKKYLEKFCESQNIKWNFQVFHIPQQENEGHNIRVSERIGALHYPSKKSSIEEQKDEFVTIESDVYIANLYDIVSIYNQVGDELFDGNVRYHVKDSMDVEKEMCNTLKKSPEDFFLFNNGIVMRLQDKSCLDRRKEYSIKLTYKKKEDFSVVNGAQTISTAAEFFYQQSSDEKSGAEEEKNNAKEKAQVLLRICYPEKPKDKASAVKINEKLNSISIALNRQKPIKPTDVQYSCPEVLKINELFTTKQNDLKAKPFLFYCVKRGQNTPHQAHYQLGEVGRVVMAYYHNTPGSARAKSVAQIVCYETGETEEAGNLETKQHIYAPMSNASNPLGVFMQWYRPVNFAMQLMNVYDKALKNNEQMTKKNENEKVILNNGKLFFAAWVINQINDRCCGQKQNGNFEQFPYSYISENKEQDIIKYIFDYAELVDRSSAEYINLKNRTILGSNDFKTDEFYGKWCEYAQTDNSVTKWINEFDQLLEDSMDS